MKRIRFLARIVALAGITSGTAHSGVLQGSWSNGAPMPVANNGAGSATISGLTYVVGGCADWACNSPLQATLAYNAGSDTWTPESDMPTARGNFGVAVAGGLLYAMGGVTSSSSWTSANEAYNPSSNSWAALAPVPTARYGPAAVTGSNGLIYLFGGNGGSGPLSLVEAYNPSTDSWTCSKGDTAPGCAAQSLAPIPEGSEGGAAFAAKSTIYLVVGASAPGHLSGDVLAYSVKTGKWKKHPVTSVPTPRYFFGAAFTTGKAGMLYVIGGASAPGGSVLSSANEAYSFKTKSWTTEAPLPTAVVGPASAVTTKRAIQIAGGADANQNSTALNQLFTP
ncbi:MAG TPA: kelch repeat-containing protein [Chloroflexota bacterium]|nr:kelch repeat-containing protein [Chloroflexota bacterium]